MAGRLAGIAMLSGVQLSTSRTNRPNERREIGRDWAFV